MSRFGVIVSDWKLCKPLSGCPKMIKTHIMWIRLTYHPKIINTCPWNTGKLIACKNAEIYNYLNINSIWPSQNLFSYRIKGTLHYVHFIWVYLNEVVSVKYHYINKQTHMLPVLIFKGKDNYLSLLVVVETWIKSYWS